MNQERALLRAVAAEPDEDLPRLVYADWLDDHGRAEWAEFIRAQVRLARVAQRRVEVALDVGADAASAAGATTRQRCRCLRSVMAPVWSA